MYCNMCFILDIFYNTCTIRDTTIHTPLTIFITFKKKSYSIFFFFLLKKTIILIVEMYRKIKNWS